MSNKHIVMKRDDEILIPFFDDALRTIIKDYQIFSSNRPEAESKAFGAYHSACRAALSHLDMVIKLKEKVSNQIPDDSMTDTQSVNDLIRAAKQELDLSSY